MEDKQKYRATGRTTRLTDHYIQELFLNKGEWVLIKDHEGHVLSGGKYDFQIVKKIQARFRLEHGSYMLQELELKKEEDNHFMRIK